MRHLFIAVILALFPLLAGCPATTNGPAASTSYNAPTTPEERFWVESVRYQKLADQSEKLVIQALQQNLVTAAQGRKVSDAAEELRVANRSARGIFINSGDASGAIAALQAASVALGVVSEFIQQQGGKSK